MKLIATYQKLRGGYYTPKPIADFLARWAIQTPTSQVLEPSCGDGALLQAATETLGELGANNNALIHLLHGIEFDPIEARKAGDNIDVLTGLTSTIAIYNGDFFAYCHTHLSDKRYFDAIIGNPPFIRYQNFPEEQRNSAFYLMQSAGLHPTRLTNAWVPFLVASTLLLKENGRLAMVIPAELLRSTMLLSYGIFSANTTVPLRLSRSKSWYLRAFSRKLYYFSVKEMAENTQASERSNLRI